MFCNRGLMYKDLERDPYTNKGNRLQTTYKLTFNEDGTEELVETGFIDVYEEIQSHADSVDIHKIIEQCTITGDMSELYKTQGFYGDLAAFPTTRAEAIKMLSDAENIWNQLPVDVKKKFDNNVNNFFATAFTEEWSKKLEIVPDVKEEKIEGDVNE